MAGGGGTREKRREAWTRPLPTAPVALLEAIKAVQGKPRRRPDGQHQRYRLRGWQWLRRAREKHRTRKGQRERARARRRAKGGKRMGA